MPSLAEPDLIVNPDGSVYHICMRPEDLADTVIVVGDPQRVHEISDHFTTIDHRASNRDPDLLFIQCRILCFGNEDKSLQKVIGTKVKPVYKIHVKIFLVQFPDDLLDAFLNMGVEGILQRLLQRSQCIWSDGKNLIPDQAESGFIRFIQQLDQCMYVRCFRQCSGFNGLNG